MTRGLAPDEERMLAGLRAIVAELGARIDDADTQQALASASALVDELTLRLDHGYYGDYARRGAALLDDTPPALRDLLDAADRRAIDALRNTLASADEHLTPRRRAAAIDALRDRFRALAADARSDAHPDFLSRVLAWESEIHARSARFQPPPVPGPLGVTGELTRERFEGYLLARFPERRGLRLLSFTPLIGGFQKLTVMFETEDEANGRQELVLRGEQRDNFVRADLGEVPEEFRVLRILFEAGVPVPEPLWVEEDATRLGRRFMVSRRARGTNCGSMVSASEAFSREAARALVTALARIHTLPLAALEPRLRATRLARWFGFDTLRENSRAFVRYWRELVDAGGHDPSPTFELIYRWLIDNAPAVDAPLALVHCDFGPHNVLVEDDAVTAIVDWELVRLGDPALDLAYLLQCVEGRVTEAEVLQWYVEAGGLPVDEFRLRYWEAYSTFQLLGGVLAATALYANDPAARHVWATISLKWKAIPFDLVPRRIAAGNAVLARANPN